MRSVVTIAFTAAVALAAATGAAHAGPISGVSLTTSGAFRYEGLGGIDPPGGPVLILGEGLYTLGACSNDGVNSTCIFSGTYQETAGTNVGDVGGFTLTTTYAGTSLSSPIRARSSEADANSVGFTSGTLNGALMTLVLAPGYGGLFAATLPPFPPTGMGFTAFLAPGATCTGGPATCSIGDVGLDPGAVLTGTILPTGFRFTIPQDTPNAAPVPEPATVGLLGLGLAGLLVRRFRR